MKQLFVYGLLKEKTIQDRLFNRIIKQQPYMIEGYGISDKLVNGMYKTIEFDSDEYTYGVLLHLEDHELDITDRFEGVTHGLYKRINIGDDVQAYIHEVSYT
jgi:hypothetical protein